MLLFTEILGIITMLTLITMLIGGSIILIQILNQLRYKNYLMEKLTQHIYTLTKTGHELYSLDNDSKPKD